MELRHLRYFVAVAEVGSKTRAAKRLGIQQPPLGQQIKALEDELGVSLFDRQPKHVRLNASGKVFLERARDILSSTQDAVDFLRRYDRGDSGALRVGFTSSASLHPLTPSLIKTFHRQYPQARIDVEERETYELVLALKDRRIDTAFLHVSMDPYPDLQSEAIAHEAVLVALPTGHRLAGERDAPVQLHELMDERFVAYRRTDGPGIIEGLLTQLAARKVFVKTVREVSRLVAAINLVAAGEGLTLVPETMRGLHAEAVTYRPLAPGALKPLPLYVATRRTEHLPILANFIRMVHELRQVEDA
jgi:DNA-binding transcriptional LysR family regulator